MHKNYVNKISGVKGRRVCQIKEPFKEEMQRIRIDEFSQQAIDFAFKIESIENKNKKNNKLVATNYNKITKKESKFYYQYKTKPDSASIGMLLTNIDLNRVDKDSRERPIIWQMGPERRRLALAQRALYFDDNQNNAIYKTIKALEQGKVSIPPRINKRSKTIDEALGIKNPKDHSKFTRAMVELGYKKVSTNKTLSRRKIIKTGLFNMVGKYPRRIIGIGAMPPVSGWRDVLVTASVGHMICFVPRSSIYASNIKLRIDLANSAKTVIRKLKINNSLIPKITRNIGAAIGAENPKKELKVAKALYKKAGIKTFRIYTIGSDVRVINTAKLLRQTFGSDIEIFVGQIADKKQASKLIDKDIKADGLIFGHGGGQQCTSAINGMAITTLEDVYQIALDKSFNNTSILVEGGLGRSIGTALILGVDCGLGNQKLIRGTIETGGMYVKDKRSRFCQPYPGTASPVTQIIESENSELRLRRMDAAGRTYYSEGKPGFMYFEAKANSMAFWISDYLSHAARTLADLGVNDISELRSLLAKNKGDFLRILSEQTQYLSTAHWNLGKY